MDEKAIRGRHRSLDPHAPATIMVEAVQSYKGKNLPLALFLSGDSHPLRDLLSHALM